MNVLYKVHTIEKTVKASNGKSYSLMVSQLMVANLEYELSVIPKYVYI